jgi:hypothetical protein
MDDCVLGALAGKTRVLVTHQVRACMRARHAPAVLVAQPPGAHIRLARVVDTHSHRRALARVLHTRPLYPHAVLHTRSHALVPPRCAPYAQPRPCTPMRVCPRVPLHTRPTGRSRLSVSIARARACVRLCALSINCARLPRPRVPHGVIHVPVSP